MHFTQRSGVLLEHTEHHEDMMDKKLFDHDPCTVHKPLNMNYNQMPDRGIPTVVSIAMHLRNLNVLLQVMLVCEGDLDGCEKKSTQSFLFCERLNNEICKKSSYISEKNGWDSERESDMEKMLSCCCCGEGTGPLRAAQKPTTNKKSHRFTASKFPLTSLSLSLLIFFFGKTQDSRTFIESRAR